MEVKVRMILNAKNAYCDADNLAEYLYELNYCDVKKLDDERVELVFDQVQLERVYEDFGTLERFVRDAIAKNTEALEEFVYRVDLNNIVVSVDIEFKDVYVAIHAIADWRGVRSGRMGQQYLRRPV